jgi:uncharacterized protein
MTSLISLLVNTAPLIHRVPTPGGLLKRAKYVARGVAQAHPTREWFDFLQQRELEVVVRNHPCLYHKLQRPYLSCMLTTEQRLAALKEHYRFVLANMSQETMAGLYGTPGLKLASFTLDELGEFELRLSFSRREKEGDFCVNLVRIGTPKDAYSLAFSVWKYGATQKEIFIGGLQGSPYAKKDVVVSLTRALYGLRPKALLVFVVQQLASCWGISHVRAVSDATHIYRHFQKRKELSTCYDEFWIETGGTLSADGTFELPAAFVPREILTIKPNKRQMYRRRYELLAKFADQIHAALPKSAPRTTVL